MKALLDATFAAATSLRQLGVTGFDCRLMARGKCVLSSSVLCIDSLALRAQLFIVTDRHSYDLTWGGAIFG